MEGNRALARIKERRSRELYKFFYGKDQKLTFLGGFIMEAKKENKVLEWMKEHKKAIIIATGVTIGTAVGVVLTKKLVLKNNEIPVLFSGVFKNGKTAYDVKPIGTFDTCSVVDLWKEGDWLNSVMDDIKVSDVGKFGEDLMKNVPGITKDTILSAVLSTKIEPIMETMEKAG